MYRILSNEIFGVSKLHNCKEVCEGSITIHDNQMVIDTNKGKESFLLASVENVVDKRDNIFTISLLATNDNGNAIINVHYIKNPQDPEGNNIAGISVKKLDGSLVNFYL